ncbi:MAG: PQQ-dependent catabolism-associated CXXCW motif protein [Paracoccus sp. (in: a-proteobacteria)]|uniref:PQQ-dependent catabolism-associated CXXCW motif protein n=1 Tax=Paracoccus sp. TaxID=267 RepID=UPI0026E0E99D|nr:PQQ-dependent catabolism-associated CXXCW motif protein [Paracoccus sp. (in: a-proteobacteria)]MDO5631886.1 PQQ-dependent catabolism-associated CXXCW motif protein [Paracoccus sp. (in: a-proteobacteria)]
MIHRRLALGLLLAGAGPAAAQVPEPDVFRGEPYHAPVPATLKGARVIDGAQAIDLHEQGVPFLDTMPRTTRPEGLPAGTIWRQPRHLTIPGAVWLYDTGYQRLSPAEQVRLESGLDAASAGDKSVPMVIFCRADCWQSWNAARRAVQLGYSGVIWFPSGSDGWLAAGGADLVTAELMAEPADP